MFFQKKKKYLIGFKSISAELGSILTASSNAIKLTTKLKILLISMINFRLFQLSVLDHM